jgi:hypothetical protein
VRVEVRLTIWDPSHAHLLSLSRRIRAHDIRAPAPCRATRAQERDSLCGVREIPRMRAHYSPPLVRRQPLV